MTIKRAIITGCTGTIGHALIDELIGHGIEIFALCNPVSKRVMTLPQNPLLHIIPIDLADLVQSAGKMPKDCDVFYHFGWNGTWGSARNDTEQQEKNISYTLDAVELAHECGCHTFVGAGSQAEYGRCDDILHADTPCFPENGYGIAKLCAGQMSRIKTQSYGMKHIWARVVSAYGPYDGEYTMIISAIRKLLAGEKMSFTKGEQLWDYIYSKDLGRMMFELASEKSRDGKVYLLCRGDSRPLSEYITVMRDCIDPGLPLGFGEIPYADKQVMRLCADSSDIVNDLHFEYQYTFERGIMETIEWCRNNPVAK